MSRRTFSNAFHCLAPALALAVVGLVLPACSSQDKKDAKDPAAASPDGDIVQVNTFSDDDLYTGVPEDKLKFGESGKTKDSDVIFRPDKDADDVEVAEWVRSRRDVIEWCINRRDFSLNEHGGYETIKYEKVFDDAKRPETRLDQAIAIAMKVIGKVPDAAQVRLRLAQCTFIKGANEYWMIDAGMWQILDLRDKGGADNEQKARDVEKSLELHRRKLIAYHLVALRQFQAYENQMPMQKPNDYYWKIHFQLGNWKEALHYLDETLQNENLSPDRRAKYQEIEKDIQDYLVDSRFNESAPKPGSPERLKQKGAKQGENATGLGQGG